MARISWPVGSSPWDLRYSPIAPATQLSSTSLIDAFKALPTARTSSSGIGWHHATRLVVPGLPFRRVLESSGISAMAAKSLATCKASLAMSTALDRVLLRPCWGSLSMRKVLAVRSPAPPRARTVMLVKGLSTASANQSSAPLGAFFLTRSGGGVPPSTREVVTEISAMPSAMQWWMRTISALPFSPFGPG